MKYNFEWDSEKAKSNLQKHNIKFDRAAEIFLDPFILSQYDDEHSEKEDRWITIGKDRNAHPATQTLERFDVISVFMRDQNGVDLI